MTSITLTHIPSMRMWTEGPDHDTMCAQAIATMRVAVELMVDEEDFVELEDEDILDIIVDEVAAWLRVHGDLETGIKDAMQNVEFLPQ